MERKKWLDLMDQIAAPILIALSHDELHCSLPTTFHPSRKPYCMLEAFGRTIAGLAPWIELEGIVDPAEAKLQAEYRQRLVRCFANGTDPKANDFMNFTEPGQPLVDAAYVAHFLIRAPKFAKALPKTVKTQLIKALKSTRQIMPPNMNWNLFSAMIEGGLAVLGAEYDLLRVIFAIRLLDDWYLGDGVYGDGPVFHWDYYNSFVMQPMAIDLLDLFYQENAELTAFRTKMLPRFTRYAEIQERLIGPEGSYPLIGRSIIYRSGAFQVLAQAALQQRLPSKLTAAQVRDALSAVNQRTLMSVATFDETGWLRPGVAGFQPELAEPYISIGSLYMCCAVFLPLGLPVTAEFWQDPPAAWTSKKAWSGAKIPIDHSL